MIPRRCSSSSRALLFLAFTLLGCRNQPALNVYLITLDTTRADHLGCYGHESIDTPNIDRLAAEGTLYERCYTPVPITLPSHLSIMSGTYPSYHGVHENGGFYVAPEMRTLAEVLKENGYQTAAFVGAFPLDAQTGLDQGFDLYDDDYPSSLEEGRHPALRRFFDERPAADVAAPTLAWLDQRGKRPFFLWTHFFDPHQPHDPPSPYRERYEDSPYDGEIAAVDEAIGQIIGRLEKRGLLDHTLIVLTADHGEGLGDHGELTHALLIYSSTIRVPLIVRDPTDPRPRRIRNPVATVDIMPSILERLGIGIPEENQGRILLHDDAEFDQKRAIPCETLYGALLHGWSPLERLTTRDWMYLHGPNPKLYNPREDPDELEDLGERFPQRMASMRAALANQWRRFAGEIAAGDANVSPEKLARLAALGYVGGFQAPSQRPEVNPDLTDPLSAIAAFREMNEGKQLAEAGQTGLGVAILEHARKTDPDNPYLLMSLATAYQSMGDTDNFGRMLNLLLAVAPEHLIGHLLSVEFLTSQGNTEAALDALRRALELDPKNLATRLFLARRLEAGGEDGEALEVYRYFLAHNPRHTLARNRYATLCYRLGLTEEAATVLQELRRDRPFYAPAFLNLAVIQHDLGHFGDSERLLERALRLRPDYAPALELHAMNLEALGREDEAGEVWRQALQIAPDESSRSRIRARLPPTIEE